MSLTTHSKFYYVEEITEENFNIEFDEGGSTLIAEIPVGSYTLTELTNAMAAAMTAAGGQTYTGAFNRTTRKISISAASNFSVHVESGIVLDTCVYSLIGWLTDRAAGTTYLGDEEAGIEYSTQFILQSYVSEEDYQQAAEATINKSASGRVEVVSFGTEKFYEMDFKFITNIAQASGSPIRNRAEGVDDFRDFVRHLTGKLPVEFMPDEGDVDTYVKLILDTTPLDSKGAGYKLKELYDKGLPGYFESGVFKFRVQDQDL